MSSSIDENYTRKLQLKQRYLNLRQAESQHLLSKLQQEKINIKGQIKESNLRFENTLEKISNKRKSQTPDMLDKLEIENQQNSAKLESKHKLKLEKSKSKIEEAQEESLQAHLEIVSTQEKVKELIDKSNKIRKIKLSDNLDQSLLEVASIRQKIANTKDKTSKHAIDALDLAALDSGLISQITETSDKQNAKFCQKLNADDLIESVANEIDKLSFNTEALAADDLKVKESNSSDINAISEQEDFSQEMLSQNDMANLDLSCEQNIIQNSDFSINTNNFVQESSQQTQNFQQSNSNQNQEQQTQNYQSYQNFEERLENLNSWKKGDTNGLDLTYVTNQGEKAFLNLQRDYFGNVQINIVPLHKKLESKLLSLESNLEMAIRDKGINLQDLQIGRTKI